MVLESEGMIDVVEDEEEIVAETGESVASKDLQSPSRPSKATVEHHNLTHFPYRSWC